KRLECVELAPAFGPNACFFSKNPIQSTCMNNSKPYDPARNVRTPNSMWTPRAMRVSLSPLPLPSPLGLAITNNSPPEEVNPKGIPSLSPGLRGTSYPGCDRSKNTPTLKRLRHLTRTTPASQTPAPCFNPFRVDHNSGTQPRVAR